MSDYQIPVSVYVRIQTFGDVNQLMEILKRNLKNDNDIIDWSFDSMDWNDINPINERFNATMGRKDRYSPFTEFFIKDKDEKIPTMHFLSKTEMDIVYEMILMNRLVFEDCI